MLLSDSGRHQLLNDRSDRFGGLFVSKRQLYAAIGVVVTRGRIRLALYATPRTIPPALLPWPARRQMGPARPRRDRTAKTKRPTEKWAAPEGSACRG